MSEERRNPFPGLRPFEYHEYELFFGREEQYEEMNRQAQRRPGFSLWWERPAAASRRWTRLGCCPRFNGGLDVVLLAPNWRIAMFRPRTIPIWEMALELNHPRVFGDRTKENGSSDFKLGESTNWANLFARAYQNRRTRTGAQVPAPESWKCCQPIIDSCSPGLQSMARYEEPFAGGATLQRDPQAARLLST
jgi:hypothetical protein